ncbi:hypothetical protein D8674_017770 [Pyrus ussuriensis x Pyrus communis]|uniref:Uncharacterized protein n=1 Tax=Pyrus ussuriensis x Pyrus communis TaxID=2448454 RepID=A0A5N5HKP7_9ROSA|nr:hypothetical protein D8674_017770 [Pyrus ussuriensis x Pyrus communis]
MVIAAEERGRRIWVIATVGSTCAKKMVVETKKSRSRSRSRLRLEKLGGFRNSRSRC